jgi:hypothetical protein
VLDGGAGYEVGGEVLVGGAGVRLGPGVAVSVAVAVGPGGKVLVGAGANVSVGTGGTKGVAVGWPGSPGASPGLLLLSVSVGTGAVGQRAGTGMTSRWPT